MANNSILFIPFILFILSNSFRRSYALSAPHNAKPQFDQNFYNGPLRREEPPKSTRNFR